MWTSILARQEVPSLVLTLECCPEHSHASTLWGFVGRMYMHALFINVMLAVSCGHEDTVVLVLTASACKHFKLARTSTTKRARKLAALYGCRSQGWLSLTTTSESLGLFLTLSVAQNTYTLLTLQGFGGRMDWCVDLFIKCNVHCCLCS